MDPKTSPSQSAATSGALSVVPGQDNDMSKRGLSGGGISRIDVRIEVSTLATSADSPGKDGYGIQQPPNVKGMPDAPFQGGQYKNGDTSNLKDQGPVNGTRTDSILNGNEPGFGPGIWAGTGFHHRPHPHIRDKTIQLRPGPDKGTDQSTDRSTAKDPKSPDRTTTNEPRSTEAKPRDPQPETRPDKPVEKEPAPPQPKEAQREAPSPETSQKDKTELKPTDKPLPKEPSPDPRSPEKPAQSNEPTPPQRIPAPPQGEPTRTPDNQPPREIAPPTPRPNQDPVRDTVTTPLNPTPAPTQTPETPRPPVTLNTPLEDARTIVADKINHIRESLQTSVSIPEAKAPIAPVSYADIKAIEPPAPWTPPRAPEQQRDVTAPPIVATIATAIDRVLTPTQPFEPKNVDTVTRQDQQRATQLLDSLEKVAKQLISLNTLRNLDRALETACISVIAGGVIGALGAEHIIRETLAATHELLARIREMGRIPRGLSKEIRSMEESLEQLEKRCLDRDFEKVDSTAGMVVDITGRIEIFGSGTPVPGITVDGGSLGTSITDSFGEFRFSNVPLETGYVITARDMNYSFFPGSFVGTVSTTNHLIFSATKL